MYRVNVQRKQIILLLMLIYLQSLAVFSQTYSSKDNYTGAWETPSTWDPVWTIPQTAFSGITVTINGYITVNGSVSINGTATKLVVNDTLVIKGNLLLNNNNYLTVNDNGILIVMGNFTINNQTTVIANGYLVVAGSLTKNSSQGSFTSNDNPVKVFIGGIISPADLTNNNPYYSALNCTAPTTTPYLNSTCSYGNIIDLESNPFYSFFQNTCTKTNVKTNSPVCVGNAIHLTSSDGTSYSWSGPNGFTSSVQNPSISNANPTMAGAYIIIVTAGAGCMDRDTINVTVNSLPIATTGSNSPVCAESTINLTSSGGTTYSWKGPNSFTSNAENPQISNASTDMSGTYTVTVTAATGCTATKTTSVIVNALPIITSGSNSPVCVGNNINLTSSGGTGYSWSGPGGFTSSAQNPSIPNANAAMTGNYTVTVTAANGCTNKATQSIIVNVFPIAKAGTKQELKFVFETKMNAELSSSETGEWSLISGSGIFSDIHSPTTRVTELSGGENIFLWTVRNGNCVAEAEVKIIVYDPFIPSVITPDGDGKNDYFKISEIIGKVELIIFNRWGNEEYTNRNYLNDWDGRNNKGAELPNDTYFYILKFDNVNIKKGSVLIKR
jgi:gliding motility-associated-like protein